MDRTGESHRKLLGGVIKEASSFYRKWNVCIANYTRHSTRAAAESSFPKQRANRRHRNVIALNHIEFAMSPSAIIQKLLFLLLSVCKEEEEHSDVIGQQQERIDCIVS